MEIHYGKSDKQENVLMDGKKKNSDRYKRQLIFRARDIELSTEEQNEEAVALTSKNNNHE